MIRLELRGTLREAHDDGIHRARDGAHHDARQDQPGDESQSGAHGAYIARAGRVVEPSGGTVLVEGEADGGAYSPHAQGEEEEDVSHEVVGDDGLPAAVAKEGEDVLPRLDVSITVQSHVHEGPLVEVLEDALQTSQYAVGDADEYPVIVIPRALRERPEALDDGHEQAPEADGPERRRQRAEDAAHHPRRAARGGVLGGEPPRADGTGDGDVGGVLYDLVGEEVAQEEEEEVAVAGGADGVGRAVAAAADIRRFRLRANDLIPHSHERDGPEQGPSEGDGDEDVRDENNARVLLDGGRGHEEVYAGERNARPDGLGVADEDQEEYRPEYPPQNSPAHEHQHHHRAAKHQHHDQRYLDQQRGDAHHDGKRHPRQYDRDRAQDERGVQVSVVIVPRGDGGGVEGLG
mmetsp:Transcript_11421/g.28139  ORF Transcript_11421/g.28139 Transcript_11421/m.28139 type:complete len:405 (+) Transcript_11421:357-1571(+)